MKAVSVAAVLLSLAISAFSQKADDLSTAVVYLENKTIETRKLPDGEYEVYLKKLGDTKYTPSYQAKIGTGFLVGSENALYLVTAKHVADLLSLGSTATIKTKGDKPMTFALSHLTGGSKTYSWLTSAKADVAVLRLNPPKETLLLLQAHFFPKDLLEKQLASPSREKVLLIMGFPLGLGVQEFFSPVSKESKAASGLLTIEGKTYFLLDSPSIGGYSGAPVFLKPGGRFESGAIVISSELSCLGIVTGTISDETGGKLATVVPSAYILELMQ